MATLNWKTPGGTTGSLNLANIVLITGDQTIIGPKIFDNPIVRYASNLDPSSTSNLEQSTTIMNDTNNDNIGQDIYSVNASYIEHRMRVVNSNLTEEGVANWADLTIRTTSDKKTCVLIKKHNNLTIDLPSGDSTTKIPTTQWVQGELGGYSKTSHTHSYLPLSGGTLTNQLIINRENGNVGGGLKLTGNSQNFAISIQNTNVTKGTTPSSLQYWGIDFYGKDIDSYNKRTGMIEAQLTTNNVSSVYLRAYNCTSNTNTNNSSIGVHVNNSGDAYTSAPTPSTSDNSTKIATTAYVKSNVPASVGDANTPVYTDANGKITSTGKSFANYLPLSGGTMTGVIHTNGSNGSGGYIGSTTTGIRIIGGSDFGVTLGGGVLDLDGRENEGSFRLASSLDSTDDNKGRLVGAHDGTLTWNGRYVLVQGVNGSALKGYQHGQVTTSSIAANSSGTGSVVFDLEFGGIPRVMVCLGGGASNASVSLANPTKSGFTYTVSNMSSSSKSYYVHWIAIY